MFYSQVEGGRLVYLAPTHRSRDEDEILANLDLDAGADLGSRRRRRAESGDEEGPRGSKWPTHPALRLIGTCAQEFKGMTRHAVIMEKAFSTCTSI